jgi:hypothetical protein
MSLHSSVPKSHSSVEFCRAAADLWVPPVEWPIETIKTHGPDGRYGHSVERVSIDGPKIYNGRSPIRHHCQSRLANQCFRPHPFREMTIENRDKNKIKKKGIRMVKHPPQAQAFGYRLIL